MEKDEILKFARQMKPREHVIIFYYNSEDKHQALFMAHSDVMIRRIGHREEHGRFESHCSWSEAE